MWQEARSSEHGDTPQAGTANPFTGSSLRHAFTGRAGKTLLLLVVVYTLWQLTAGTNGVFLPTILQTFGSQGQGTSVLLQGLGFLLQAIACLLLFMPFADRKAWLIGSRLRVTPRWLLFGSGAVAQVMAFLLFGITSISTGIALANVILFGVGVGISHPPLCKTLFQELFPTRIRATAQGVVVAVTRFALSAWYFVLPFFEHAGITVTAFILVGFLVLSSGIALAWRPKATA
jgi:inositol transporter-like SP family MFS transporter